MADIVSAETRSRMMSNIRGRDTKPELLLRKGLHARGFRFRCNVPTLPGKPDIVLARYRAVIFVHGCFWHGHDCHLFKWPKTRETFWRDKIQKTRIVDTLTETALTMSDWRIAKVWECAIKGKTKLPFEITIGIVEDWLNSSYTKISIMGTGSKSKIPTS